MIENETWTREWMNPMNYGGFRLVSFIVISSISSGAPSTRNDSHCSGHGHSADVSSLALIKTRMSALCNWWVKTLDACLTAHLLTELFSMVDSLESSWY